MPDTRWQPSCDRAALAARSAFYRTIREFFYARDVLEVDTPLLGNAPVSDPNIEPMQTREGRWLHTSPEYAMKRLLCAGSGDIWQLCKVFRAGEAGRRHNPEFSMLEWYRVSWSLDRLMDEVRDLVRALFQTRWAELPEVRMSYASALKQFAGIDVHKASDDDIAAVGISVAGQDLQLGRDGWLDIIMSHRVEPALSEETLVFIYDFPASQAALAKVSCDADGNPVAERFELFFNGTELANGYHELTDAEEQRRRFEKEADGRPLDEQLLSAIEQGLPECSGVAMGVDRLLMHLLQAEHISDVLSFDWPRA
ncbi:MAG: EF-P lysine aminoacylase GenX [Thalassolituus maritimus]|uniref:Lysyl-tRNA synthetase, class 2 n=1 Tax=Thalassolituus maritimus TaxID=484498 RepID=A0A1N7NNW9_9GAMM|nr:EF-P lysine aminoacylase EpmA [Thalassolituus maritimus]TPD55628.1 MAG: EF-P lysine aminoacylase GenX [Thalassolituus maritimus]SIT00026.1 lysyl-tRNA synthetase, class 2 [Thalassolituus maritimus]